VFGFELIKIGFKRIKFVKLILVKEELILCFAKIMFARENHF
jgi:hypothetical protein